MDSKRGVIRIILFASNHSYTLQRYSLYLKLVEHNLVSSPECMWKMLLFKIQTLLQEAEGSGFFELQILEIANYRGEVVSGACCGGVPRADASLPCPLVQCQTFFRVCLKEYQSNVTSTGSCSFGNASSPVLGGNSFTLADPDRAHGKLVLPFTFRWTVSFQLLSSYITVCL